MPDTSSPPAVESASFAARPINILLIEDNPGDARLAYESLASRPGSPFNLIQADRLSDGLDQLVDEQIDVVLLDLSLPDSLGLDSLAKVQQRAPNVPVVVMSTLDHPGVAGEAKRSGAHEYLVKSSYGYRLLERTILNAMERHHSQRELDRLTAETGELHKLSAALTELLRAQADGHRSQRNVPLTDAAVESLMPEYSSLLGRCVRVAVSGAAPPTDALERMADRLCDVEASGAHVLRLHVEACARGLEPESAPGAEAHDRLAREEVSRWLLVTMMTRMLDRYLNAARFMLAHRAG